MSRSVNTVSCWSGYPNGPWSATNGASLHRCGSLIWSYEITKQAQEWPEDKKCHFHLYVCGKVVPKLLCCDDPPFKWGSSGSPKCFTSSQGLEISLEARLCWFTLSSSAHKRRRTLSCLTRSGYALQHPITPQKKEGENQMSESFIVGQRKGQAGLFLGPLLPQWRCHL